MQNDVGFCMQNISDTTGIVLYMNCFCFLFLFSELGSKQSES